MHCSWTFPVRSSNSKNFSSVTPNFSATGITRSRPRSIREHGSNNWAMYLKSLLKVLFQGKFINFDTSRDTVSHDDEQSDRLHHDQANIQHRFFQCFTYSLLNYTFTSNIALGSAIWMSPNIAKEADHKLDVLTPRYKVNQHLLNRSRSTRHLHKRQHTFLQPPEAAKQINGWRFSIASSERNGLLLQYPLSHP